MFMARGLRSDANDCAAHRTRAVRRRDHRGVRASGSESGDATIIAFTCIRALTGQVRCGRVRLLRLLVVEHDEPVLDAGSDSVEGATISISASASKMSLG